MRKVFAFLFLMLIFSMGCIQHEPEAGDFNNTTKTPEPEVKETPQPEEKNESIVPEFKRFSSEEEMREYLIETMSFIPPFYAVKGIVREVAPQMPPLFTPTPAPVPTKTPVLGEAVYSGPERFSGTNVQVRGIDEPDIVKTDGVNIYVSRLYYGIPYPRFAPEFESRIVSVMAYPPENLSLNYEIPDNGELLLHSDTLIALKYSEITGYNKSDGKEKWRMEIDGKIVATRLYNDSIYLLITVYPEIYDPCPVRPVMINGESYEIRCVDVYFPVGIPSEIMYSVLKVNPENGKIEKSFSFMGGYGSTVYMSQNAIYIAYQNNLGEDEIFFRFLKENRNLFPRDVVERIEQVMGYDLSGYAKYVEIQHTIQKYLMSLGKDERLKFESDLWNRMQEFREAHKREIQRTYIVKVDLNLEPVADGEIAGRLLNQFSMDEYSGYLRVATTFGDENDLYVLDSKLNVVGSIQGYGRDERIYAVRFIGDRGYIVTFRETDPFFVIDLSNPENPEIKGELKIPGFSSYLHPISEHLILGIGREEGYVKISMFDVSNPERPEEKSRYLLKESWSEVLGNHHAFMIDQKHGIFFLPAGAKGYVFSYDGELRLVKVIDNRALRALYIDDYLYIVGDSVAVYDEYTWEKVNELKI